jgi:hypothetical protein
VDGDGDAMPSSISWRLTARASRCNAGASRKAIECLGRANAAVELAARKQLRLGCRTSTSRALCCKPSLDATRTMALTACGWERSIGWPSTSCVFKCCKVTAAPAPGKALDQGALDGAQPIGATEITFDIGDKAIECLGRASATVRARGT